MKHLLTMRCAILGAMYLSILLFIFIIYAILHIMQKMPEIVLMAMSRPLLREKKVIDTDVPARTLRAYLLL